MDSAVPSPAAPEAKQPSMNERFQKLISEGTPEELEAEVKSCQAFLGELRKPLEGFVAQNKDAHHWVAQIGRSYTLAVTTRCAC